MAFLGKKYKFVRDENFEAFIGSWGLPEEETKMYKEYRPTQKLTLDGDTYTFTAATPQSTKTLSFKSGVEFDEKSDRSNWTNAKKLYTMAYLGKVYKYHSENNFDGFLKSVGLTDEQVQKLLQFKPTTQLVKEGDKYKYINVTSSGTRESVFEPGVEVDDVVQGGIPIKSVYTIDGNTVTQTVSSDKGKGVFKREYNGDDLKVTITTSKWDGVAYRYYKA